MNTNELESAARALVAPGKGILAADESLPTMEKRFKSIGLLQEPVLEAWKGIPSNVAAAQEKLRRRANCNSAARQGKYRKEMETEAIKN